MRRRCSENGGPISIHRLLVANRGEIAVRIVGACRKLGVESVLAASEADMDSLAAGLADRVVCIGPPAPRTSYLNIPAVIAAALGTHVDAIHPGYGFLAEQAAFAEACEAAGLLFVGPQPEAIRQMGDKLNARDAARRAGVPVVVGSAAVRTLGDAEVAADSIGYPVLVKASAGGGGRGMHVVENRERLHEAFKMATAEIEAAFGDSTVYLERYIADARHVEVQVLGDVRGGVIHLGDRDCSLQRRYQKLVEEAPAPITDAVRRTRPDTSERIRRAAVAIAQQISYVNAGTVEFLLDQETGDFYFLEMNTRIQVEHPVTEEVTGIDLIAEQIRVAGGADLGYSQDDVKLEGAAVECRINAESPANGFRPCPGKIEQWAPPGHVRLDTHCFPGYVVPPHYDSLLGKLVTRGADRLEAILRMQEALARFTVTGIDTSIPFLRWLLQQPEVLAGTHNTSYVERRAPGFEP